MLEVYKQKIKDIDIQLEKLTVQKNSILKKVENIGNKISSLLDKKRKIENDINARYIVCKGNTSYKYTCDGLIIPDSNKIDCGYIIDRKLKDQTLIEEKSLECNLSYRDWINSGGNEYCIDYKTTIYVMCPKCRSLHVITSNSFKVIDNLGRYEIDEHISKLKDKYPTSVKIIS